MQNVEIPLEARVLGTPTMTYEPNTKWQWLNLGAGLFFLLGGLLAMLVGPVLAIMEEEAGPLVISFCGFIAAALGAWTVYSFFRDRGWRVLIFPNGLAQERTGQTTVVPWDDVTHFWYAVTRYYRNRVHIGTTYNFTLQGPEPDKWAPLRPAVYEEGQPVPLARAPLMQERPYAPVPVADELRKQFLAITDPRHPLVRHVSAPIKIQPFWTIGSGPLR